MNPRPAPVFVLALALAALVAAARPALAAPGAAAAAAPAAPRIEVLFVLDSTGSMASAIHEAKERILAIGAEIASGDPRPDVRFGIVTFRDRGDAYVTKRWPLTRDWDATRAALATIEADGGGDTPEAVVQALHEGIRDTKWTLSQDVMKVVYLIGDAPPKRYDDDPDYRADLAWAVANGIVVQSLGCRGLGRDGEAFFREVAAASEGHYHAIGGPSGGGGAVAGGEVRAAEEEPAARVAPEGLAAVVARTARAYSGELGVRYDEAAAEPVSGTPLVEAALPAGDEALDLAAGAGPDTRASGLTGEHGRVVRDAASWRRLWAAHTSSWPATAPLPPVDFHSENVVVVSVAEGALEGLAVSRQGETLFVRPRPALIGPRVAFVRIPAHDGPVRFVTDEVGTVHLELEGGAR